jgi:hypothetical protein
MSQAVAKPTKEQVTKLAEGWRFVTIPTHDVSDYPAPIFRINKDNYGPGTHLVNPDVAGELESRLRIWQASCIRLMSNKPHAGSLEQANRGSANSSTVGAPAPADPAYINV